MTDEVKFKEYMAVLGEIHGKEISTMISDVYWKVLEPFDDEDCVNVFKKIILELKFFPKPVDFLVRLQGDQSEMAMEAWLKVVEAIRRYGNYQSVSFDDRVIHSCIEAMGGWPKLCEVLEDDLKWREKEFLRLYPIMKRRGKHPAYLIGLHETENANSGFEVEAEVAKIGFNKKLKLVSE